MWPFKRKPKKAESPQETAAFAKLDNMIDEAGAGELDEALALNALGRARGGLAGGLAMAGSFDRERLLEKADEADEDARP
jgi:hypothetical protein